MPLTHSLLFQKVMFHLQTKLCCDRQHVYAYKITTPSDMKVRLHRCPVSARSVARQKESCLSSIVDVAAR